MHWTDTHTHRSTDGWRECLMTIGCSCSIESDAQPNNHARCLFKNCASLISCNFDIQRLIFRPNHMQSISAHILTYILSWAVLFMTRSSAKKADCWSNPDAIWCIYSRGTKEPCVSISPMGKDSFDGITSLFFEHAWLNASSNFRPLTVGCHIYIFSVKNLPPPLRCSVFPNYTRQSCYNLQ